jgi:hypothetical protein
MKFWLVFKYSLRCFFAEIQCKLEEILYALDLYNYDKDRIKELKEEINELERCGEYCGGSEMDVDMEIFLLKASLAGRKETLVKNNAMISLWRYRLVYGFVAGILMFLITVINWKFTLILIMILYGVCGIKRLCSLGSK